MAQKTLLLLACLFAIDMGTLLSMDKSPALTELDKKLFNEIYKRKEEPNLLLVDELIQKGAHINAVSSLNSYTPLMEALAHGHGPLITHLIHYNTLNINYARLVDGLSALQLSMLCELDEPGKMVQMFLDYGALPAQEDILKTAERCDREHEMVLGSAYANFLKTVPLLKKAQTAPDYKLIQWLYKQAPVEQKIETAPTHTPQDFTPAKMLSLEELHMHLSQEPTNQESAGLLAQVKDIDARYTDGRTLLMIAASRGNFNFAKMLFQHNACPTLSNDYGKTPYNLAAENNHTVTARIIESYTCSYIRQILKEQEISALKQNQQPLPFLPVELTTMIGLYAMHAGH